METSLTGRVWIGFPAKSVLHPEYISPSWHRPSIINLKAGTKEAGRPPMAQRKGKIL
jgi:hypothetical protein